MKLIFLFFTFPFLVFALLKCYNIPFTFSEWLGFLGGYCGAIGAFIAANLQLTEQRKIIAKQLKEEKRKEQLGSLKIFKYYFEKIDYYLGNGISKQSFIEPMFLFTSIEISIDHVILNRKEIEKLEENLNNLGIFEYSTKILEIIDAIKIIENIFTSSLIIKKTNSTNFESYIKNILRSSPEENNDSLNLFNKFLMEIFL